MESTKGNDIGLHGEKPMKNELGQFTREGTLGELNPRWKGDDVGYYGIHTWMKRTYGKAGECEECGSNNYVQWANLSGEYKRDRKDWRELCVVCHRYFDGITKLSKEQAQIIKDRYDGGETQVDLAQEYSVDQGTISNICRDKIQCYVS